MFTALGWILLLIAGVFIFWNSCRHKKVDREIRKAILTQTAIPYTLMHLHAAPLLRLVNEVLGNEGLLHRQCHAHKKGLKELAKQFDQLSSDYKDMVAENTVLVGKNDALVKENSELSEAPLLAGDRVYGWQQWLGSHPPAIDAVCADVLNKVERLRQGAAS